ncbi:TetR/AcrR family transcriptional regulator [Streptococcus merionis]|uniref:Putative transcriptional regulator n=1 Tax=Streptococcus merionis TaxID=400065 RepID=A0A239SNF5_9STRE|nr:TetR/AcrR family transcriptional regulator [Streptococcus merionis]SNU86284.1 putative transcriptional regulator [Streptococcus merionis]
MVEEKKQALKTAAYQVFSQKGYKATGISEIAKQAGVAVGSFYNYYDSKEDIFLDVYIAENNRIRQEMMDGLDWEAEAVDLVTQLFAWSRKKISSNKILLEWYNPAISDYVHSYFASEKGRNENLFHQFLIDNFTRRLLAEGFSQEKVQEILQVYQLFYYMDMHITESDFPDVSRTIETLATNFVKGIFK